MKWNAILMSVATIAFMASCGNSSQQTNAEDPAAVTEATSEQADTDAGIGRVEYVEAEYDFGTITEGEVVDHVFKFKNTGDAPVILSQVSASCGCTTPDYTKEPVLPGNDGEIKVSFNSLGQVGVQQKIISIMSNADNRITTVQIKGTVEKK